jgi:hypothetical protein
VKNDGIVIKFPDRHDRLCEIAFALYKACAAQHEAIDRLFAELVAEKPGFLPSKSGQPWAALVEGHEAMKVVEDLRLGKEGS